MKKSYLFIAGLVLAVAILPLVGNKYVQSHIEDRVSTLNTFGLGVQEHTTDSSYLSSKQHYEFLLQDSDKFLEYLSQYSDKQIPSYVNAALDGILVGVDVEYSNIPFTKAISIDIYPLALSPKISEGIKEDDLNFYTYLEKFLESKGVLYHINYNIVSKDFDGYLKDLNENYTLKDGTKYNLKLEKAVYAGHGDLIAPSDLSSSVKSMDIKIEKDNTKVVFTLAELESSYSFNSNLTYLSSIKIDSLEVVINGEKDNVIFDTKDLKVNVSSNDQGDKAELNTKASVESLKFKTNKLNVVAKDFAYDMAVNEIDKNLLQKIQTLISKSNISPSNQLNKEITDTAIELFSKGLKLKIAQWSLKEIILNDTQNLGGLDIKMDILVKEDPLLASKIKNSPMQVAQNIDMILKMKISKLIFSNIIANQPMAGALGIYMKEEGKNLIFDLTYQKGELKLNGKALR